MNHKNIFENFIENLGFTLFENSIQEIYKIDENKFYIIVRDLNERKLFKFCNKSDHILPASSILFSSENFHIFEKSIEEISNYLKYRQFYRYSKKKHIDKNNQIIFLYNLSPTNYRIQLTKIDNNKTLVSEYNLNEFYIKNNILIRLFIKIKIPTIITNYIKLSYEIINLNENKLFISNIINRKNDLPEIIVIFYKKEEFLFLLSKKIFLSITEEQFKQKMLSLFI